MKVFINFLIKIYWYFLRKVSRFIVSCQIQNVGKHLICDFDVLIYGGDFISIGNYVVLNKDVIIQSTDSAKIFIGDYVTLSYGVKILTGNLSLDFIKENNSRSHSSKPIFISNDVWIGANSVILPGVEISEGVVVGAGSIVTKSITKPRSLYAGNPAKFIKFL